MLPYTVDWNRVSPNNGYRIVHCNGHPHAWSTGYVYEHIVIMEHMIDRLLTDEEEVHHKDTDRSNNSPSNLELKENHAAHMRVHGGATMVPLTCKNCGIAFERRKGQEPESKNAKNAFCSRRCNGLFYGLKEPVKKTPEHGMYGKYRKGCRCAECRSANTSRMLAFRSKKKLNLSSGGLAEGAPIS